VTENVRVVSQIISDADISKYLGEIELGSKGPPIGNGTWRIEWSRIKIQDMAACGRFALSELFFYSMNV